MVIVKKPESLRQRIYALWVENPYITPKETCRKLGLNYKEQGAMVRVRLSEFRCYHKFGSALKAQSGVRHRRVFVWENISRDLLPGLGELGGRLKFYGWGEVVNRNGLWVFRDVRGAVHWYKEGLVRLYLRGPVQLARAKELFCRAFSWFSAEELKKYVDVPLREESKHWEFLVGAPMPRFDIRQFERSHGIRIYADNSHPESVEVEETRPFWLDAFEDATEQFGKEIQEHLKLIELWQGEAKLYRTKAEKKPGLLKRLLAFLW